MLWYNAPMGKKLQEFFKSISYIFSHKKIKNSFTEEQSREIKEALSLRNGKLIIAISLIVLVHQIFCVASDIATDFYGRFSQVSRFNIAAEALLIFTSLSSAITVHFLLQAKKFKAVEIYQWAFNFLILTGFLLYVYSDFARGVTSTSSFYIALLFGFGAIYTLKQTWGFFAYYFTAAVLMDLFVPPIDGALPLDNLQSLLLLLITPIASLFYTSSYYKNMRTEYDLKEANLMLEKVSNTDWLTDLPNRRSLYKYVADNAPLWKKEGKYIAVAIADVDDFKAYNDTFTHVKGDECLIEITNCLAAFCKKNGGFASRTGGEEFCFVCVNIKDKSLAEQKMAELAEEIKKLNLPSGKGATHPRITISMGISISKVSKNYSFENHYTTADNNLYAAKEKGKNTFVVTD